MRLSIVTTLYNSAGFIDEFYRRAVAAAETLTDDFEIVMVNDGSPDDSLAKALDLHELDARVVVIDLSRNFGHHRAMMAGLGFARGEQVFLIDVDLEEDPGVLPRFAATMEREHCDVVYGIQAKRRGGLIERASGELFYWLAKRLGGIQIPRNDTTARLMTRRYVRNLVRHREREIVLAGLWMATGFRQVPEPIVKLRASHPSNYSFAAKTRLAVDYLTSFSDAILYRVFYAGLIISTLAFCAMLYFVTVFLVTGKVLAGWTSLMASIWTFGGLSVLLIGLIGIYVARIFNETKRRPYVIVREIYRAPAGDLARRPARQGVKTPAVNEAASD